MISYIKPYNNISFKAQHKNTMEHISSVGSGYLNHTTSFFRYNQDKYKQTDKFLIEYLREKANKNPLTILSAGCSFGEEVYSYALGLNNLNPKPKIVGIDASQTAINEAKKGMYTLNDFEKWYLVKNNTWYDKEFRDEMRKEFSKNFEYFDEENKTYKLRTGSLNNCDFLNIDIQKLVNNFRANSQDCILCRYVLYHLTSLSFEKPDEYNEIFMQLFDILKPGGILCLNSDEYDMYDEKLLETGFVHFDNERPWLYQKPKTIGNHILSYFRHKLLK